MPGLVSAITDSRKVRGRREIDVAFVPHARQLRPEDPGGPCRGNGLVGVRVSPTRQVQNHDVVSLGAMLEENPPAAHLDVSRLGTHGKDGRALLRSGQVSAGFGLHWTGRPRVGRPRPGLSHTLDRHELTDLPQELVSIDGLVYHVVGPGAEGAVDHQAARGPCDRHDRNLGVRLLPPLDQLDPVGPREVEVDEREGPPASQEQFQALLAVLGRRHVIGTGLLDERPHEEDLLDSVLDQENGGFVLRRTHRVWLLLEAHVGGAGCPAARRETPPRSLPHLVLRSTCLQPLGERPCFTVYGAYPRVTRRRSGPGRLGAPMRAQARGSRPRRPWPRRRRPRVRCR